MVGGEDAARAIGRGRLKIRMHGEKLRGVFTFVKMKGRGEREGQRLAPLQGRRRSGRSGVDGGGAWRVGEERARDRRASRRERAPKWISKKKRGRRRRSRAAPRPNAKAKPNEARSLPRVIASRAGDAHRRPVRRRRLALRDQVGRLSRHHHRRCARAVARILSAIYEQDFFELS